MQNLGQFCQIVVCCYLAGCVADYSRAHLIHMANVRKNHANYPSMRIIRVYYTLCSYEQQQVVSRASMQIKRGMLISEGQIIRAILYHTVSKVHRGWGFLPRNVGMSLCGQCL